ncbi:MAG TPA: hypothetical protein VGN17_05150 [Bryobacteraceae bacterium]|jgi:hypothetical protein
MIQKLKWRLKIWALMSLSDILLAPIRPDRPSEWVEADEENWNAFLISETGEKFQRKVLRLCQDQDAASVRTGDKLWCGYAMGLRGMFTEQLRLSAHVRRQLHESEPDVEQGDDGISGTIP